MHFLSILIVGIFHSYAHEYACQVLYSPRMIEGMGWTDGEDVERLWSESRHVVAANRVTGAYTRRQTLTNLYLAIGQSRVRNFPHTARKKLREMLKRQQLVQNELNSFCMMSNITIVELIKEVASMKAFFLQPLSSSSIHIEDDIASRYN